MSNPKAKLNAIRCRINEIDEQLIALMAERTQFAGEIARLKMALDMPINDEKREREIQEKTRKLCEKYNNFNPDLALKILKLLMDYNKEIQMKELKNKQ
ncbi:chorismate mutase [Methanothermococcus okinawensis]|uniref:Chorismate mutase, type II n=1 Tax=Methanothermococcus okinawensis (strain DSM 14208 / JCM 11175 / IH1) TaxID=647113 RepID=F8AJP1_METOI|nr:chorismate mutase [Methanothermococcus okinawensis]AEH07235.1 Chorismate mutase, type II [Methanothermococcus okinawensis IH1]